MRTVIRLTESDLVRLVKRVILEQGDGQATLENYFGEADTTPDKIKKVLEKKDVPNSKNYNSLYQTNDKEVMVVSDGTNFYFLRILP